MKKFIFFLNKMVFFTTIMKKVRKKFNIVLNKMIFFMTMVAFFLTIFHFRSDPFLPKGKLGH